MCEGHQHPSAGATLANLLQPMPLRRKLELVAKNVWIRISKRSSCCGNYGEPGC